MENYIGLIFRAWFWELLAAMAGTIYLRKVPKVPTLYKYFVYYLWITFIVDVSGAYLLVAYYEWKALLKLIEGTIFYRNYWLFNPMKIFSLSFYCLFFILQLESERSKKILSWLVGLFFISAWINLIVSGKFFIAYAAYTPIVGSILLSICIAFYLLEMLNGDKILNFYKNLTFYVAVGALLWHLTFTPMFIYNNYKIMGSSAEFLKVYLFILGVLNFVMYGLYTVGFIVEIKNSKRQLATDN